MAKVCCLSPPPWRRRAAASWRGGLEAKSRLRQPCCANVAVLSNLRDYMAEIDGVVQAKLEVCMQDLTIWSDHVSERNAGTTNSTDGAQIIEQLDLESIRKAFEADVLKLARDMSNWAEHENKAQTSERKAAIARVLRLKEENKKGASLVISHMERNCKFKLNHFSEEHFCITEA